MLTPVVPYKWEKEGDGYPEKLIRSDVLIRTCKIVERRKCHSYLQEKQEGGPRELEASQHHLDPWEGNGAANPGNHFQAHEGQESHQE
ncbi:hypothetical protein QYF61_021137 [Mycteria americana]|uniref:Uncharacterized protein n=1 Tax=Mycteria americana TaxID=33587 RepID=A0AAN7S1F3_MYCAM|nr:hypothetical protein QYF61_021137 [Mycteria americana]